METTATFTISEVGEETGKPYNGDFTVKTVLTRRDRFVADQIRREVLGGNPDTAAPALQTEAFILGQLKVRITSAPKFWTDSNNGLDLEDGNIILAVFTLAAAQEEKRREELQKNSKEALERLSAKP